MLVLARWQPTPLHVALSILPGFGPDARACPRTGAARVVHWPGAAGRRHGRPPAGVWPLRCRECRGAHPGRARGPAPGLADPACRRVRRQRRIRVASGRSGRLLRADRRRSIPAVGDSRPAVPAPLATRSMFSAVRSPTRWAGPTRKPWRSGSTIAPCSTGVDDIQGYNPIHLARYDTFMRVLNGAGAELSPDRRATRRVSARRCSTCSACATSSCRPSRPPIRSSRASRATLPTVYADADVKVLENDAGPAARLDRPRRRPADTAGRPGQLADRRHRPAPHRRPRSSQPPPLAESPRPQPTRPRSPSTPPTRSASMSAASAPGLAGPERRLLPRLAGASRWRAHRGLRCRRRPARGRRASGQAHRRVPVRVRRSAHRRGHHRPDPARAGGSGCSPAPAREPAEVAGCGRRPPG